MSDIDTRIEAYNADLPRAGLQSIGYLAFPFRMTAEGGAQSGRLAHVREQIEQVLFTTPPQRVFRPEFGAGARRLVFEPNSQPLWELTKKRLQASLAEALAGEVDARTLTVEVGAPPGNPEQLLIRIAYELSAVRKTESHTFQVSAAPGGAP
jgi:phage baseplate assembly protein W